MTKKANKTKVSQKEPKLEQLLSQSKFQFSDKSSPFVPIYGPYQIQQVPCKLSTSNTTSSVC